MLDLRELLKDGPIILDGAMGTNLQKMGMPMGVCPEQWILEHRAQVLELERAYVKAGSRILYAPTFTASRFKLAEYHLEDQVVPMNRALAQLAREAADRVAGEIASGGQSRLASQTAADGPCYVSGDTVAGGTAAGKPCYVAGDLTMTGQMLKPMGTLDFEELVHCYKEQAQALVSGGVDLFVIETMMHIGEARAALLAVKEICDLPVMVTMTIEDTGKTMFGTDAVTALVTLQSMGADAVGLNCSTGPDKLLPWIREMIKYATVPLVVKPNAGLPKLITGETVFDMGKEDFARHMKALVEAGAAIVGGCCGTTPEYIRLLSDTVEGMTAFVPERGSVSMLTGEHSRIELALDAPFVVIGERINPTGKKALREELKGGCFDMVQDMAVSQADSGAGLLDINVGMSGIDEKDMMLRVIDAVSEVTDLPLCIDSSSPEVVAAALRHYHGRALVNSVSCEKHKLEHLLPVVKKYGAMFILLPLNDAGLPENFEDRKENLLKIMERASSLGFYKEDMVADGLVATLGANPMAGADTLKTIEYCHDVLGIATVCGLSNISFGLPDRSYVNSIFLALAISKGLTMAIANPSQELLMRSACAADLVVGKPEADLRYIENAAKYNEAKAEAEGAGGGGKSVLAGRTVSAGSGMAADGMKDISGEHGEAVERGTAAERGEAVERGTAAQCGIATERGTAEVIQAADEMTSPVLKVIFEDVLKGKKKLVVGHVKEALDQGFDAPSILNGALIPAINQVGEYFNSKKYFLPQLMLSAEAMRRGVDFLEPLLQTSVESNGYTVVIATVEGDIHDIGKNLVAMMMKNYGFHVIDLGKDVSAQIIVETAGRENADIIALSALMTTTMQKMRDVVMLARERKLKAKIIIGGAVITQDYADEIGADGYSEDAVGAVALVKRLMGEK